MLNWQAAAVNEKDARTKCARSVTRVVLVSISTPQRGYG
jgi:hypothetical protein